MFWSLGAMAQMIHSLDLFICFFQAGFVTTMDTITHPLVMTMDMTTLTSMVSIWVSQEAVVSNVFSNDSLQLQCIQLGWEVCRSLGRLTS